jgi:O-antigen/teichoic acid export membrane protein
MSGLLRQRLRGSLLRHQLVQGVLGVGGLKLLSLPLTFAASVLLARGLGPTNYGHYSFVIAVVTVLSLPIGPGMSQLITREVARYAHRAEWGTLCAFLLWSRRWVLTGSGLMLAIIAVLALWHGTWELADRWTLLVIASTALPMLGMSGLQSNTLRGLHSVISAQIPELFVRPALQLAAAGCLVLAGVLNPWTAQATQVAAAALGVVIGARLLRRARPQDSNCAQSVIWHAEWTRTLLPFVVLGAVAMLNTQIGILALGSLGNPREVAALQLAQSGALLVGFSLTVINSVIAPHVAKAYQDGNQGQLQVLFRQSARAALALAVPVALPLIVLGRPIVQLVYGNAYTDSVPIPLAILAAGQLINVAFGSVGIFLCMTGYERETLTGQVTGFVVNIIGTVVLIPWFGAVGAACASTLGLATWNGVLAMKVIQRLQLRPTAL